jgi:hypothetical protein
MPYNPDPTGLRARRQLDSGEKTMSCMKLRAGLAMAAIAACATAQLTGPTSSVSPYVIPNSGLPPGAVTTTSLITTGDSIGGYRFVGIPDGLGAFDAAGAFTVLCNHELGATSGIVRAHGSTGSFVSRWVIDTGTKALVSGRDHNQAATDVHAYDRMLGAWIAGTFAWDRHCSADLAPVSAFSFGGLGTANRIFLTGEETRPPFAARHGSAWANVASGPATDETWELPHLGQCAYENLVAAPFAQVKTIVIGTDDSDVSTNPFPLGTAQPSEVYVYVGNKQATGNDIEKAGLTGGTLYGVRVRVGGVVVPEESNANGLGGIAGPYVGSGTFELVSLGDASTFDGAAQQAASIANDVFRMQRVEDGAWDPRPGFENDFYFVTPASASTNSRLFRLRFTTIGQPELGGQIDIILTGSEGQRTMDNLCIDPLGRILLQEDPGGASRLAKVWMYDLVNGRFTEVAAHDPYFFMTGAPGFETTNEEASGVIPVFDALGAGWYLMSVQNHKSSADVELVEGGQLVAMYVGPTLGRELEFWYSSVTGAATIETHIRFGAANGVFFSPVGFVPGNFPNGSFFGVDIAFIELVNQYLFGAPFSGTLDASGRYDSPTFNGVILSGITVYGVAIDDVTSLLPQVSAPVAYTIPAIP